VIIDDPALAAALSGAFDEKAPLMSYEVVLGPDGEGLEWIERTPAGETRHTAEPQTGFFRGLGIGILSLFPIDSML
jgi:putative cardiolipin synthase